MDKRNLNIFIVLAVVLLASCGDSYEQTKELTKARQREAQRRDSMALKVAVMPTLDCLPLFVADELQLLDTVHGGVRLKMYTAQMDCDTAIERSRVEVAVSDIVRAERMKSLGTKLGYFTATEAYWQLISNRRARINQISQLEDKMVAMTRFSATNLLADRLIDSVKLKQENVFRVQVNDVNVRLSMLENNEMDAVILTEPQATQALMGKHRLLADTRKMDLWLGAFVYRQELDSVKNRRQQMELLTKAYNQACDSINKYGVRHFRDILINRYGLKKAVADSVPKGLRFYHVRQPREKEIKER